jgi:hypothetical protein
MGFLVFDTTREIVVEDRVLARLQVVIIDKLRRAENFGLNSWSEKVGIRDPVPNRVLKGARP